MVLPNAALLECKVLALQNFLGLECYSLRSCYLLSYLVLVEMRSCVRIFKWLPNLHEVLLKFIVCYQAFPQSFAGENIEMSYPDFEPVVFVSLVIYTFARK
jgi:hypothetical protein